MTVGFKDRAVVENASSKCYFNLHKKKFSMKQNNLVVLHATTIYLKDVTFSVNEKGRQKVIREKRKNVHAYVNGLFLTSDDYQVSEAKMEEFGKFMKEAYYNPYTTSHFIDKETGEKLESASLVALVNKRIFYVKH